MQNEKVSIKKNYIYNTFYRLLTVITPFITAPYVSRVLGADRIGIQSFTESIVTYFALFAALGTASYGQREIAMARDSLEKRSRLFWEIEILSILTTLAVTAVWVVWIFVASRYNAFYLVLTITLVSVAFDISWYYSGLELFRYIVIRNSVVKILGIILLFVFVHKPDDVLLYVGIGATTGLLGNISMWSYLPKLIKKVPYKTLRPFSHFKNTLAYFIPTIAISVYTVLDKTMIGIIVKGESKEQNGFYEQATKIVRMTQTVLLSLNTVMASRMSYLFAQKKEDEIRKKIDQSFDCLMCLAIAIMFGLIGIAKWFVPWFYGEDYAPVIPMIMLMSPIPFVVCISNILGNQYLTPSGQRVRSSKGIILGAVVNFLCNLILIRFFQAAGAILASVLAETIISISYVHMSKGFVSWLQIWGKCYKRLIAGGIMCFVVFLIGYGRQPGIVLTLIQVCAGALIYAGLLWVMKDSILSLIGELNIFKGRRKK